MAPTSDENKADEAAFSDDSDKTIKAKGKQVDRQPLAPLETPADAATFDQLVNAFPKPPGVPARSVERVRRVARGPRRLNIQLTDRYGPPPFPNERGTKVHLPSHSI
jgi:hypothetical protein